AVPAVKTSNSSCSASWSFSDSRRSSSSSTMRIFRAVLMLLSSGHCLIVAGGPQSSIRLVGEIEFVVRAAKGAIGSASRAAGGGGPHHPSLQRHPWLAEAGQSDVSLCARAHRGPRAQA